MRTIQAYLQEAARVIMRDETSARAIARQIAGGASRMPLQQHRLTHVALDASIWPAWDAAANNTDVYRTQPPWAVAHQISC